MPDSPRSPAEKKPQPTASADAPAEPLSEQQHAVAYIDVLKQHLTAEQQEIIRQWLENQ